MKKLVIKLSVFATALTLFALSMNSCSKDEAIEQKEETNSLKISYSFDEYVEGKVPDNSSRMVGINIMDQKNNATPKNLKIGDGKKKKALVFDNASSSLLIPYGLGKFENALTVDFWINLSKQPTTEYRNIISEITAGHAASFKIGIEDQYISFDFVQNPTITKGVKSSTKLEENTWYHITFIYDGTSVKLFINGNLDDSKDILMGQIDSWNRLNLGYVNDSDDQFLTFYGAIDEFRVWDKRFSNEEVKTELMVITE